MDFLGSSLGWRTVLLSTSTVDIGVKKSFKIKRLSIYQSHKYTEADERIPVLANIFHESIICVIRNSEISLALLRDSIIAIIGYIGY